MRGGDASAQDGSADVVEARLLLGVDADVVAIGVWRRDIFDAGIELEAEADIEFAEETFGRPAVLHEEVFDARAVAVFAQAILVAENFAMARTTAKAWSRGMKAGMRTAEMRIGGESAADAHGVADFALAVALAHGGGEGNVIDFRVGAPDGAACDRDFEFAREIVEIAVGGEQVGGFDGER